MKLLDWVDINKINWENLSKNPNAISLLEKNYLFILIMDYRHLI